MRSSTSTLALTAATLFAVTAGIDIPYEQHQPFADTMDYVLEGAFSLSLGAGAAAALMLLRAAGSRLGRTGWGLVTGGYAALTVVTAATAVAAHDVLGPVFGLALLAIGLGSITLCVADATRRLEPRGSGVVMLVSLVAMVALGDGYGLLGWAAGWFAVAALARQTATERSPEAAPAVV